MKTALAFSTKDRTELTKQSIQPLLICARKQQFDLFIFDGSNTKEGEKCAFDVGYPTATIHHNVRGGADPAIVYSLTTLLNHPENYDVIGLCENDVLLSPDFFGPMMALFERGKADGLEVGAVSPRAYEDRILCQRDGYALMHNLGAGVVFYTRQAANIVLENFRTSWSTENRNIFALLSGIDIARYWAFRGSQHWLCADWGFDKCLAAHGLASLALTPSPVEMIGQVPPLAEQGLTLATLPVELRDEKAFILFADRTRMIRDGNWKIPFTGPRHQVDSGAWMIFPHQLPAMGGSYTGHWRLKWAQGFGPFAYRAGEPETRLIVPVYGPCSFCVSGGANGGQVQVDDLASGFTCTPQLPPEGEQTTMLQLTIPGGASYREIILIMLTPGTVFYGLQTQYAQPVVPAIKFDHLMLPSV